MNRSAGVICFAICLIAGAASGKSLELVIQSGHLAEIGDVAYSPNGCFIATAGTDNRVILWSESLGKQVRSFSGDNRPHTNVTYSVDGRSLFVGTAGGSVTRWQVNDGRRLSEIAADESASVAMNQNRTIMATTGGDSRDRKNIVLWNARTGQKLDTYTWPASGLGTMSDLHQQHQRVDHKPIKVAMGPRGDYFATTGEEGRTILWKRGSKVPTRFFNLPSLLEEDPSFSDLISRVQHIAVAFSPDGRFLAGAIASKGFLWPLDPSRPEIELTGHDSAVTSIAFSADGNLVATGTNSGQVKIWNARTGSSLSTLKTLDGTVNALAFRPTKDVSCESGLSDTGNELAGQVLVTAGASIARVWSLSGNSLLRTLAPRVQPLNDIAFNADGSKLAVASSASPRGSAKIWDLTSGYDVTTIYGHKGGVNSIRFSPDGRHIATAGVDNTTVIWNANTMTLQYRIGKAAKGWGIKDTLQVIVGVAILTDNDLAVVFGNSSIGASLERAKHSVDEGARALAFFEGGRYLAMGGERRTKIWDLQNEKRLGLDIKEDEANKIAVSADGKQLLMAGRKAYRIPIVPDPEPLRLASGSGRRGEVTAVDLSPDGTRYAIAHRGNVRVDVRDFATGRGWKHLPVAIPVRSLEFNADGSLLAAGDEAGNILLFRIDENMALIGDWSAHSDTVFGLDFSPDGRMLASAGADGVAHLWDTDTWQKISSFVSIGPEDFVILSPDNYYAASTNGHAGLAFRLGNTVYPFEQFDLKLNRPDLVFRQLGTVDDKLIDAYSDAHRKRLQRRNLTESDLANLSQLPEATLKIPTRTATSEKRLSFTITATDSRHPIRSIGVWVNDVPHFGSAGYIYTSDRNRQILPVNLKLSQGRNKIQVSATNSRGAESVRKTVEMIYDPPTPEQPDLYVVAIGVSDYGDENVNLQFAAKDAKDLTRALKKQNRFRKIHETLLLDSAATRDNILATRSKLEKSRVDDEVVVFVAGHGLLDKELDYYFATPDIDFDNPIARGLSYEQLEFLLDGIPARRKVLLMDTCYSGEVDPDAEATVPITADKVIVNDVRGVQVASFAPEMSHENSFHLMQKLFANLGRGSGAVVLSASAGDEFAYEGQDSTNGVFTYSIIESIKQTDNKDYLRLSQLRQRVVARVQELTAGAQTPSIRRVNLEFDHPFYSRKAPKLADDIRAGSLDFEQLFMQAAELSVFEDY